MFRAILSALRFISLNAFRFFLICVGAWLTALEPAESWADARRAANAASGHMPNMDPGVMVSMALVLTIPILIVLLVVELTRWAWNGKTLALPSYLVLGAVATCPVGYSIGFGAHISNAALYPVSALMLGAFYLVRWAWMARRARRAGVTEK
jgi:hypothetical protein